jgi:hypothetical protein
MFCKADNLSSNDDDNNQSLWEDKFERLAWSRTEDAMCPRGGRPRVLL